MTPMIGTPSRASISIRSGAGEQLVLKNGQCVASLRRLSARRSRVTGGPPYGHWALILPSGLIHRRISFCEVITDAQNLL